MVHASSTQTDWREATTLPSPPSCRIMHEGNVRSVGLASLLGFCFCRSMEAWGIAEFTFHFLAVLILFLCCL